MPCNGDYLEATPIEISYTRALAILEELKTGFFDSELYANPYDNRSYGKCKEALDILVEELCSTFKKTKNIKKLSLEAQIWWRDHQKADKLRVIKEQRIKREEKIKQNALKKLSAKERAVLNI